MLSPFEYAQLFWSLLVFHLVVMWFSFLRASFIAKVTGLGRAPALPRFVWVSVAVSFFAIYAALVFSARSVAWDTGLFFLVSVVVLGIGSVDFSMLSRRLVLRSRAVPEER